MTWQSRNTRVQPYIRRVVVFVIMVMFGRTDMPMESNAYLSLALQTDRDLKRPNGALSLRGLDWDMTGIAAVDQENVWVVGNVVNSGTDGKTQPGSVGQGVLQGSKGIVLRSTDGGQSWTIRRVEPGKYFSGVHFVDRMTGWVSDASDQILKTTDAGDTWVTQLAPTKSFWCDLQFIDSNRGWILGADGFVLRTQDGGREWKLTRIVSTSDLFFMGFADESNGWIAGENGAAYETTDSGNHWRSRGDELRRLLMNGTESEITFRTVKFVDSKVGFIAADVLSKHGAFSAKAVVFKTVDRGRTWTASIIPKALGIRSAEFLTRKEAWIVPGDRAHTFIFRTEDGGVNWSALRLPRNCAPGRVSFVDSKHGWFLNTTDNFSSDQIFSTKDGGQTWGEIKISERIPPS